MRLKLAFAFLVATSALPATARPFHDEISSVFRSTWAPTLADCRDPEGVEQFVVDGESINYYEGNDYLLIGLEFSGAMTKRGGSGSLFNGRFTSRLETKLVGENNIRMEVDERDKNVMYRYPIGEDGEPIASREVKDVRCIGK